jgi:predicted thioesterase
VEFSIPKNCTATKTYIVDESRLARTVGSGSVDVLATPAMIAFMEAASLKAVQPHLPEGWTTVGTSVSVEHVKATPPGEVISVTAHLVKKDDRMLEFSVRASDSSGLIGKGTHRRFIINEARFRVKLKKPE